MLAMLTGIDASKINYYAELKNKIRELEIKNEQLREAKIIADEWYRMACADAEKIAMLYEESRVQAERLDRAIAALRSISQALTNTTQGVDDLLQSVVRTAAALFTAEYAVVTYGEGEQTKRVVYCTYGLPSGPVPALPPERLLHLIEAAGRERRPIMDVCRSHGTTVTLLCTPMMREESPVGNICLQRQNGAVFTETDLQIVQILANQAATAIENARLFEESRRLHAETVELYEMALRQKEEAERRTTELRQARYEISQMQKEQILSEERNRIARELHDNVAQILTSIGLNLELCRRQLSDDSPVAQRLASLKQLARNGIYEIRNTIFALSTVSALSAGLPRALSSLAREFEQITGLKATTRFIGNERKLPLAVETALYRVAQEALYNAFKHAEATQVHVEVGFSDSEITMQVTDNGIGITEVTIQRAQQGHTFGLRNMQSRVEELGGTLAIGRALPSGRGTRVTARLSVKDF